MSSGLFLFILKYLTKGGSAMLLDLHTKLLGKKSSSSEPLLIENVEEDEDDGNIFTLTQKITEDDKDTTYTECTQVINALLFKSPFELVIAKVS